MQHVRTDTQQQKMSEQMNRIEQTVHELSGKMDVVIEHGETHDEHLVDLKAELHHYGSLVNVVTNQLKQDAHRTNTLFVCVAMMLVGLLFWILSGIS